MVNKQEDKNLEKITEFFKVPESMADEIKNVVEEVRGGYLLIETRSRWDGSPGPWTRSPIVKMVFHKPSEHWRVYWMRASGRWLFYNQYKTLEGAMKAIKEDKDGCFWG